MNRVVWSVWFQGRERAPWLVRRCLESWERCNPGWQVRVLDAETLPRFVELPDLAGCRITHASMADLARILLLQQYGGVWVDATVLCRRPLDEWLEPSMKQGFFAFERPGPDRLLASWFLASEEHHPLVDGWCARALAYWRGRTRAHDYFWFHRLFEDACARDRAFARAWDAVPKRRATELHAVQAVGPFETDRARIAEQVDFRLPLFKLSHRIDARRCAPGTLLAGLLGAVPASEREEEMETTSHAPAPPPPAAAQVPFAALSVSTNNLGDHIQGLAAKRLLARLGVTPALHLDRDDEIASAPGLPVGAEVPILLNGWFKTNGAEWPPHERLRPVFLGFHMRLFRCPELLSDAAVDYYRRHEPIGCRDPVTQQLLAAKDVAAFVSGCLSLALPRRLESEARADTVFVASRDRRLLDLVPRSLGRIRYVNHYARDFDFTANEARAAALLERYRRDARLVVTTFLHCALPAIAMGIPVVAFLPANTGSAAQSDRERFSALEGLVPLHTFADADRVDWSPRPVPTAARKLALLDHLHALARRWPLPAPPRIGPFAPPDELPPPAAPPRSARRVSSYLWPRLPR